MHKKKNIKMNIYRETQTDEPTSRTKKQIRRSSNNYKAENNCNTEKDETGKYKEAFRYEVLPEAISNVTKRKT